MVVWKKFLRYLVFVAWFIPGACGHGYMTSPRSRNLLAYQETVWWPQTENDPEPETCPHCLNRGGTIARCGESQGQRNYDSPKNALGGPMPTKIQATYTQGQDVILNVTLTAHHKGHFVFSACPIFAGEIPSQECFDQHQLTFVEDLMHGANFDPYHPERAYVAPVNDPNYRPNFGSTLGIMDFSFKMRLPPTLYGDIVLIQWYYLTANSCQHDGYNQYSWPEGWAGENTADPCGTVSSDGRGVPEQFWNCAEVRILQNANISPATTPPPTPATISAGVAIPIGLPSEGANNNEPSFVGNLSPSSSSEHDKTIVGYYASWQWYDRNKLAEPAAMDFTKLQRVNFAFFQINESGDMWGTDSWADPNLLFGPYNWNPSQGAKQYCSWDGPNEKVCNYHNFKEGLIHLVHAAGAEIYPSIGGWTLSDPFPAMSASSTAREKFVQNCVDLIKEYDFDGIDIDWEYPGFSDHSGTPQDKSNFRLLLNDVRAKLDELGAETGKFYGLTAALPCGPRHIANMDIAHVASTLSELNLMTYDFHGSWESVTGTNAPLYYQGWGEEGFSVHDCVKNWLQGGGTKDKINIGLPFYGRSFLSATGLNQPHDGADKTVWGIDDGTPQYFNIVEKLPSMTSVWDETSWTQYAYFPNGGLVSFDDENAICAKTEYAIDNDLNGFIIWELSGDVMPDKSTPLLDVVNEKLLNPSMSCGATGVVPDDSTPVAPVSTPNNPSPSAGFPIQSPIASYPGKMPDFIGGAPIDAGSNPTATPPVSPPNSLNNFPGDNNEMANESSSASLPSQNGSNQPVLINCKKDEGALNVASTKPVVLTFSYELHRHSGVTALDAMKDLKTSMLTSLSHHLQCNGYSSNVALRRLALLRNDPAKTSRQHVLAIESTLSDTHADNYPCLIPVSIDRPSVCDSMVASVTAYFDSDTTHSVLKDSKEELLFLIRTSMASGSYESDKVAKVIYVQDLSESVSPSSSTSAELSSQEELHEGEGGNTSSIIAIALSVLIVVFATFGLFMYLSKRTSRSDTYHLNELHDEQYAIDHLKPNDSLDVSETPPSSNVEDTWNKAMTTWKDDRTEAEPPVIARTAHYGLDPIGGGGEDNLPTKTFSEKEDPPEQTNNVKESSSSEDDSDDTPDQSDETDSKGCDPESDEDSSSNGVKIDEFD